MGISSHNDPGAEGALERKLGEIEITQVDRTLSSAFELKDEIEDSDIIAIVAPVNIQQQFLKVAGSDKPVIMAKSERIVEDDLEGGESKVVFKFLKWERLVKIEVVLEDFA